MMKKNNDMENVYVSPCAIVEEIIVEGILCSSIDSTSTEEWDIVDLS